MTTERHDWRGSGPFTLRGYRMTGRPADPAGRMLFSLRGYRSACADPKLKFPGQLEFISLSRLEKGWSMKLTFNQRRAIGTALFAMAVACFANAEFGWGWFHDFDRHFAAGFGILMLVFVFRFGPTREEIRSLRKRIDKE